MDLIRKDRGLREPFDLLTDLQSNMNRIFNRSLFRRLDWPTHFQPDLEVREEKDRFIVHADLPGIKKEELNISMEGKYLTLSGERKQEKETHEKGVFLSERLYGAFSRTVELPAEVQVDKIKASYKDGVLEIALPKSESARPKQIDVEIE